MRILSEIERITRPTSAHAQMGCMIAAGGMIGATVTNHVAGALGGAATIGCYYHLFANHRRMLIASTAFAANKTICDYFFPNHSLLSILTAMGFCFNAEAGQIQKFAIIASATATAATYLSKAAYFVATNYLREAAAIASITYEVYGVSKIGHLLPQLIQGDRRQTLRNIGLYAVIACASSLAAQILYKPNKVAHWSALAGCAFVSMALRARALYLARAAINPNPPPPQPAPQQPPAAPPPRVVEIRRRPPPPQQPQPVIVQARNVNELAQGALHPPPPPRHRDNPKQNPFQNRVVVQCQPQPLRQPPAVISRFDESIAQGHQKAILAEHERQRTEFERLVAIVRSENPHIFSLDEGIAPEQQAPPPQRVIRLDPCSDIRKFEESIAKLRPVNKNFQALKPEPESQHGLIRLGPKYVDLMQISFPKTKHRSDLPEILNKMMEKEGIDGIRTNNLAQAYQLWTCKLQTDAILKYKLERRDQLNLFIREVIQKAMANPSSLPMHARQALLRVESMMIQAIVADHVFEDIENMGLLDEFNWELCRCRITQLEELLDYHFDLQAIIRKAIDDNQEQFVALLRMIPADSGRMYPRHPFEFDILIEDLFILMEATNTERNSAFFHHLPTMTFTKPPMSAFTEGKQKRAADSFLILKEMARENKTEAEVSGNAALIRSAKKLTRKIEKLERQFNQLLPSEAERITPRVSFDDGIPPELENDPIFSLFICDTTKRPICFEPYFDGIDIREARGVQNHNMHPLPAVKALIEAQKRCCNSAERTPLPSQALLKAAFAELQRVFPAFPNLDKLQQLKNSALVALSFEKGIPEELEEDMIFSLFVCPITGVPISEFVLDPTQIKGKTLYERRALTVWADTHHNSPKTREPLESSQIIPLPKLTELVSERIHSFKSKKYTQAEIAILLNTPPDLARLQEALSELNSYRIADPGLQAIIDSIR